MKVDGRPPSEVRRLLFPANPVAGQSLLGMVCDAAHDNGHRSMSYVLAAAGYPHHAHFDLAVSRTELLPRLAAVLGIGEDEVLARAHPEHGRSQGWGANRVGFFGTAVWAYDLDFRRRRVAPGSLLRSPYHRALWTHALVPFCPESGDWLMDVCPSCSYALGWRRAIDVAKCGSCGADLRDHAGRGPDPSASDAVGPVLELLAPDPERHGPALARLHPDLRELGRGGAFELGWRLAAAFGSAAAQLPRDRHHKIDREAIMAILTDSSSMLRGWPDALEAELAGLGSAGDIEAFHTTVRRLRWTTHRRRTWPEIAELLERRHPDVFGRRGLKARTVVLARMPGLVDGTGAHRLLGTGSRKFAAIHRANLVEAITSSGTVNAFKTFSVSDLDADRGRIADRLPMSGAKARLGITSGGIEQLICLGAVEVLESPVLQAAYPGQQLGRSSVVRFERRLLDAACRSMDATVPLHVAVRAIGGEKPWGAILIALAEGRLPFALDDDAKPFSRRALIRKADVRRLLHMSFDQAQHRDFPFDATINRRDAAEVLNLTPPDMMTVLASELVHAGAGGKLLDRAEVVRLAHERITPREILARWCGGGRRRPRFLSEPWPLHRRGPAGFDRAEVTLRAEGLRADF